jgi:hypothetical protein
MWFATDGKKRGRGVDDGYGWRAHFGGELVHRRGREQCAFVLVETCGAGVRLVLGVCADLGPLRLVDIEGGAGEDEPGEDPGAGTLAGGDVGCGVLAFAAAEGDKVERV